MHAEAFPRHLIREDEGLGRAIAWAVGVHVLIALLLLLSPYLTWDRDRFSTAGSPSMGATLEVSAADRRAAEQALADEPEPLPEPVPEPDPVQAVEEVVPPPPQPLPEPRPQEAPVERQPQPQERVPEPAPVNQEEVRRDAERERARIAREQDEKRRQEQIDLTERQRQQAEAEEKRRLAQQQLERIRAERERQAREAREAQERLDRLANRQAQQASQQASQSSAAATPPPGTQGVDDGLRARYAAAIQEAIARNWTRPDNVALGQRCRLYITQIIGGQVINVDFDPSCPYDAAGRRSVEAAVRKAEPLPYAGFEAVFDRRLNLNFTAQDR